MNKEYDASGITQMNFQPLVESFINRIPMVMAGPYRGHYTTGHLLVICGCEIARFLGNDLQIKLSSLSFDVYNLIPNVSLSLVIPIKYSSDTSCREVHLNGIQITDFDQWIFVKGSTNET